jgi:hypothetical protein
VTREELIAELVAKAPPLDKSRLEQLGLLLRSQPRKGQPRTEVARR